MTIVNTPNIFAVRPLITTTVKGKRVFLDNKTGGSFDDATIRYPNHAVKIAGIIPITV